MDEEDYIRLQGKIESAWQPIFPEQNCMRACKFPVVWGSVYKVIKAVSWNILAIIKIIENCLEKCDLTCHKIVKKAARVISSYNCPQSSHPI